MFEYFYMTEGDQNCGGGALGDCFFTSFFGGVIGFLMVSFFTGMMPLSLAMSTSFLSTLLLEQQYGNCS